MDLFPLSLILLFLLSFSKTTIVTENMIVDLESTDTTEFNSQAITWTLSSTDCSTCSHSYTTPPYCWSGTPSPTYQVLGGPKALGTDGSIPVNEYYQKEYPPLVEFPTFAVLLFDAYLFADSVGINAEGNGVFDVFINGIKFSSRSISSQICTQNYVDDQGVSIQTVIGFPNARYRFDLSIISESQNGRGITLKFVNLLNYKTTQRSFGIKNLKLYMFRSASQYSDIVNFPCGYSFFWDKTQGCVPCAQFCKLCTGPSSNDCTSCNLPYYSYPNGTCMATCVTPFTPTLTSTANSCNKKCSKANQPILLEYSGQCSASCNSPLILNDDGLCSIPCGSAEYLHPDNSCQTDCLAPLQPGTWAGLVKTCNVCAKYLYSDNSCQSTCPSPLLIKIGDDGVKSCYNPCAGTTNYLYPDSSCIVNCFLTIVSGVNGQYCISHCPSDYIYPDGFCVSECNSPLEPVVVGGIKFCRNLCAGYIYPDDSCVAECKSPLISETRNNIKYCSNSCQETEYLYWNGTCSQLCPDPYIKSSEFSRKFCEYPCLRGDYLYWNNTCITNCPFEKDSDDFSKNTCKFPCGENQYLEVNTDKCISACSHVYEVKKDDEFNLCIYPCSGNQYLYSNGKCEDECPLPLRELITNDFKKYCMPSGPVGGGEHPTLPGEITLPVIINKQATKLSYVEKTLNADNEAWTLSSTDYTLNPTWTFFGLNSLGEYALDHWDTTSSCGCFRQVCGNDCQQGSECHVNDNKTVPWICHPWAERNNYCWSIVSSGKKWYTSYSLAHIATITLTSYGGLDNTFVKPGFTITNQVANHNYAVNALIIKSNPRNNVNLEKSYRYAESEGRVVTIQEFEALNNIPTIQADLEKATCNSSAINLPLTLLSKMDAKLMPFHSYVILRKAELNTMKLLNGVEILAPTGVIEWNNQKEFDFIDPCNQQFLTLRKDDKGNFFVKLPASQRLTNTESIICIAVQDNSKSQYDLVLYELKNSTLTWTASNRFAGILSKDYIQDFTARLTTQANPVVTELSKNNIDVQFHIDSEPVFILVRTTTPTTCQLYLSPSCTYDISTEPSPHYATKSLGSDCGDLYEKATYNCEGLIGHFFPPNSLVKTPISNFVENTTIHRNNTEVFTVSRPLIGNEIQKVYVWLAYWTWQNFLTKLLTLLVLGTLIAGMVILSRKLNEMKQGQRKVQVKPNARAQGYSQVLGKEDA